MSEHVGICALCEEEGRPPLIPAEHLLEHLRIVHGKEIGADVEIVDLTDEEPSR